MGFAAPLRAIAVTVDQNAWDLELGYWPVMVVRPRPTFTEEQLAVALEHYNGVLEHRLEPYVVVFDSRDVESMDAAKRRMINDYKARHEERTRKYCRGSAFVFTSSVVRGMLTAIWWLKPSQVPNKCFAEMGPAMDWARDQLEADAQVVPAPAQKPALQTPSSPVFDPVAARALSEAPSSTAPGGLAVSGMQPRFESAPWELRFGEPMSHAMAQGLKSMLAAAGHDSQLRKVQADRWTVFASFDSRTDALRAQHSLRASGITSEIGRAA